MRPFSRAGRVFLSTFALSTAIGTQCFVANAATSVVNMSTRGMVGTGNNAMVAGFVIGPGAGETILIRAVGPGLAAAPFAIPGVLPDPVLTLFNSNGATLATNNSWGAAPGVTAALMGSVGAFPLAVGSRDSALVVSLPAGSYTAQVSGASGDSGVVLLEAYVVGAAAGSSPMLNFSTRLQVGTGSNIATSGLYISGSGGARTLLIRAVGPTLSTLRMTGVLADPNMAVLDASHAAIAGNDDWGTPVGAGAAGPAAIDAAFTQSYAFALPAGSKDSALITSLAPGGYTIQVTGNGGTTGVALVEVYDITPADAPPDTVATAPAAAPADPATPIPPAPVVTPPPPDPIVSTTTPPAAPVTTPAPSVPPSTAATPPAATPSPVATPDPAPSDPTVPATTGNPAPVANPAPSDPPAVVTAAPAPVTIPPATTSSPTPPTVAIAASTATASLDGAEAGLITFTLSAPAPADLTVKFSLGGTATKWIDYFRLPQGDMPVAVTIPAGSSSAALPITARANSTGANPETVTFTLVADPSYAVGSPGAATIAIVAAGSTVAVPTANPTPTTTPPPAPTVDPGPTGGAGSTGVIAGASGTDGADRTAESIASGDNVDDTALRLPAVGDHLLHVLSPSLLELVSITTKQPDPAKAASWNFVDSGGRAGEPAPAEFTVTVNGQTVQVQAVGFKRRVLYAPLQSYDPRIENSLYLRIATPVTDGQLVSVTNPDGSVWSPGTQFSALVDPQRYSPAIHVNEEGYVPALAKTAIVGYYLGDMGEMPVNPGTGFNLIDAATGAVVFSGSLALHTDTGYTTAPLPYQQVYTASFSGFTKPGQYQVQVPGLGASLPFLIDDGIAMGWTRTYALGMYEQRSGMAVSLPFTRFTHSADHTAPAAVPVPDTSPQFAFTWNCISGYAATANTANPAQTAPLLTSNEAALYPYVNTGKIDVSGGHFDAGDYSKYTLNSAQLIHELVFAADNIPGLKTFDNLGIPESGDGIPDVLQEAKWEADFLAKMQDADGGFYFLVYPIGREYESNVLPENGDPQVVWPKNTSATAASVAALAEAGSSPAMIKYYPQAAAKYLQEARLGWQFLANAIAKHGLAGSYQKITFYGDGWTHNDELAWAASAMYAATGGAQYQTQLFQWFPNPADSSTFRWGWWQMSECWGNAIRTYAFAVRSGRLQPGALDPNYLAACNGQIVAAGDAAVTWGGQCAYGTPFPPATKAVLGGGWYFSLDQASDMAVAYQINPKPAYIDGLVAAMNYEGGCNPVNVTYLEGLGLKRQQQTVSQYAQNSRRVLSPTGDTIGQVTAGFEYLNSYGLELSNLSYPSDSGTANTYPYYDRWSDAYNVTTEQITVNQARSLISAGFLASLTTGSFAAWTAPQATIAVPAATVPLKAPVTLSVQVPGLNLANTRIVWEARDQAPAYGSTYTISPANNGDQWVEAEIEWPDGRRAFAASHFQANSANQVWIDDALPANAVPGADGGDSWNWVAGNPSPHTGSIAFQSGIVSGVHDLNFTGATGGMDDDESTLGQSGSMQVNAGDTLFAWVYIDPANPPTELMLCWYDGSSYDHRAYWGANTISWGNNGTAGRFGAGALPTPGQWVELSVPAKAVGLEGDTVSGMSFVEFGGRAAWDTIGRASAGQ